MATKREGSTLLEPTAAKVAPPPLYKVLLLNDDYTPMEFVVHVLKNVFWHRPRTGNTNHAQSAY